ncbi:hypothetical protein BL1202_00673 [Bacillus licheniformis]|uniref:hypothetical protein n=1 Tax=Bacillus licheniformis TaxID=1402 RepID=UPI00084A7F7B|nr:hypothetical protein [Bacillus licheniformis]AOP13642.1 hypothetical protein BL1202_00673 [Bacillus licheniformis]MEC0478767.1 hypothetical protein [Bacillus licheniformis]
MSKPIIQKLAHGALVWDKYEMKSHFVTHEEAAEIEQSTAANEVAESKSKPKATKSKGTKKDEKTDTK